MRFISRRSSSFALNLMVLIPVILSLGDSDRDLLGVPGFGVEKEDGLIILDGVAGSLSLLWPPFSKIEGYVSCII